jgi:hypothetical protein
MSRDLVRQIVTVASFVVTVTVNSLANALPINGQTTGAISDSFRVYVVPAGYVFAIWGVIYLLQLGFVVHQARPSRRADPLLRRLGYLPAVAGVLNAAWIILWHYNLYAATVPVMVGLLVTLIAISGRIARHGSLSRLERWTVRIPFSVYLGWITVATIANVAAALASLGFDGFGVRPELIASAVLIVGIAIAATFVVVRRDVAYGLVIVWAYAGIVVKEQATEPVAAVAAVGVVSIALLVALVATGLLPPGARREVTGSALAG